MRIIGGTYKSRIITFPKTKLTRPMTDRSKETLFNILGSLVFGKQVLDLFSGSGSLGLESISRGAKKTTFVDQADWAVKSIQKNISSLDIPASQVRILKTDVLRAIPKLTRENERFSVIFVDPPFRKGLVKKTLLKLDGSAIVMPFAQVVVGHAPEEPIPDDLRSLKWVRTKKIGQSCLSFLFRLEAPNEETKSYLSGQL